ncbi:hypothetical protein [Synechococcus sp. BIOS-E4-1]|uniref:hypothetical protein n=1 Tax=Synechococcus sp. BIOS-E4-1 TaxID=1400864 RepID=UPI0016487010|nr:hypothetical protein [Synechococcus sp. BIOS-E4-1]
MRSVIDSKVDPGDGVPIETVQLSKARKSNASLSSLGGIFCNDFCQNNAIEARAIVLRRAR